MDSRNEKLGYKVREAIVKKIPYILIAGDKEVENNTFTIRHRNEGDLGTFSRDKILKTLQKERDSRLNSSAFTES
jgi:threonyl-tRNA synthetase